MSCCQVLTALLLSSVLVAATPFPVVNTRDDCTGQTKISIDDVMANWGKIWKGDKTESLLQATIMSDISIKFDRLPYGNDYSRLQTEAVTITNEEQLLTFVAGSRAGYSSYGATNNFAFANSDGTRLVTSWTVNAVIGSDHPSKIKKAGDSIRYDGIDIVTFDPCSGKIHMVQTAQNTLDLGYQLGMNIFA